MGLASSEAPKNKVAPNTEKRFPNFIFKSPFIKNDVRVKNEITNFNDAKQTVLNLAREIVASILNRSYTGNGVNCGGGIQYCLVLKAFKAKHVARSESRIRRPSSRRGFRRSPGRC